MRRYFEEKDPDYITIINNKIYRNSGGKIKKRRYKGSGFSDLDTDII